MSRLLMFFVGLLLASCAGIRGMVEKPGVEFAGLEVQGMGLLEQNFLVKLHLSNPNDFSITLDGVDFTLSLNGEHFANGASRETVILPRLGEADVSVRITTRLDALQKLIRAQYKSGKPQEYQLNGRLYGSWVPGGIPFERKGEVPSLKKGLPGSREKPVSGAEQH